MGFHRNRMPFDCPVRSKPRSSDKDLLCRRFEIISFIDESLHNVVYKVADRDGCHYAAKISRAASRLWNRHENEIHVLGVLQQGGRTPFGFPDLHFVGEHANYSVICMNLFGRDVHEIAAQPNFSKHNVLKLGYSMLERLETLHRFGFVHCDVKPQNFVLDHSGVVHIIDFAATQKYIDSRTGAHRSKRCEREFLGTMTYASLGAHRMTTQSRRDDLESLGYSLIEMMNGFLPWDEEAASGEVHENRECCVTNMKDQFPLSQLCANVPVEIYDYMVHVTNLSYADTPDYDYLFDLLKC